MAINEVRRQRGSRGGRASLLGQNARSPRRRSAGPLLLPLVLLASSLLLVFLLFRESRNLEQILAEIDRLQVLQAQVAPLELYRSAARQAAQSADFLRLFKRAYQIEAQALRSQYLQALTQSAVTEFPDSEELWAHRLSALLDAGELAAAQQASTQLQGQRYSALKGELAIRYLAAANWGRKQEAASEAKQAVREEYTISAVLAASAAQQAASYVYLARLLNQPRLAFNAALLYMAQGDGDKALVLIRQLQDQSWLPPLPAGLIAYDNRDWRLAASFFAQVQPESSQTLQYLADSQAQLQEYQQVIEILSKANNLVQQSLQAPADLAGSADLAGFADLAGSAKGGAEAAELQAEDLGSWQLYYNLASAYRETGDPSRAFEILRQGLSISPRTSELLFLLNVVAPADEKGYARSVLAEAVAADTTGNPYLRLATMVFEDNRVNQQKFGSELWQLFSKFPQYKQILHYLLWYYTGLSRTADVALALERYHNLVLAKPDPSTGEFPPEKLPLWAREYMAINAVLQGDFTSAAGIFAQLVEELSTAATASLWRQYYNLANISVYQGDLAAASELLHRALIHTQSDEDKVHIYYRLVVLGGIAGQNYLTGREQGELRQLLSAYVRKSDTVRSDRQEIVAAKLDSLVLWSTRQGLQEGSQGIQERVQGVQGVQGTGPSQAVPQTLETTSTAQRGVSKSRS